MIRCVLFAVAITAACGDATSHQIGPAAVDFGKTDCGTTASPRVFLLTNPNPEPLVYDAALAAGDGSMYTIEPAHGTLLGHGQLELTLRSKPIPETSATTENLYGDTLVITTDLDHDTPHQVAITQTAHGAVLAFAQSALDFGSGTITAAPATQSFTLVNNGNADASVTLTAADPSFTVEPHGTEIIAGGAQLAGSIAFAARGIGALGDAVDVAVTGVTCASPPTLALSASGTASGTAVDVAIATPRGRPGGGGDFQGNSQATICVLTSTGYVACTGSNEFGMRGAGTALPSVSGYNFVLTDHGVLDQVTGVQGGRGLVCARRATGDVYCWGDYDGTGRAEHGDSIDFHPIATLVASNTAAFGVGYVTKCIAAAGTGAMTCTGSHRGSASSYPVATWTLDNATAISAYSGGGLALLNDGTVMSFGENSTGERGSSVASEAPPSPVANLTGVTQIAVGGGNGTRSNRHACAVKSDGTAWCWGKNRHGQLGDGTNGNNSTPQQVMVDAETPLTAVTAISTGRASSCAIADAVYCWGRNDEGELGTLGPTTAFATKITPEITNAVKLVSSQRTTCAILATGGVRCWGDFAGAMPTPLAAFEP